MLNGLETHEIHDLMKYQPEIKEFEGKKLKARKLNTRLKKQWQNQSNLR